MPIDFAALADRFREPLRAQTAPLTPVFERLADAVKRLAEQAEAAERATRAYPVLRYRGDALSVRLETLGAPPFSTQPPLDFIATLRAGGQDFLERMGWAGVAARQELAIPAVAATAADALEIVVASLERLERPFPAMFDPRARRLSDVFGLLALSYRSLLGDAARRQLVDVAGGAGRALGALSSPDDANAAPGMPATAPVPAAVDRLVAAFEGVSQSALDALLLLPALGEIIAVAVHDAMLRAKRTILEHLGDVEAQAVALRRQVIDGITAALAFGPVAARWLTAARAVLLVDLRILAAVLPRTLDRLLTGIRSFAEGVTAWGRWIASMLDTVRRVVDAIMGFDLLGFVIRHVIPGWILDLLPDLPTITVDDLISILTGVGTWAGRTALDAFFFAADAALWVARQHRYRRILSGFAELLDIVLTPTPPLAPDPRIPTGPLPAFPDVYEAVFGGGRGASLVDAIDHMGREARTSVRQVIEGAATLTRDLGATFGREAERAATLGSPARLRELAAGAGDMAGQVFGPEADRVAGQIAGRRPDPLARAFEDVVASQGFALVGASISVYVHEMRRQWVPRRPPVERPTSPHILARHGRLGAVQVPRVTVRAGAHPGDGALTAKVNERLRGAVADAYRDGRGEFERMAAPAAGGPGRGR